MYSRSLRVNGRANSILRIVRTCEAAFSLWACKCAVMIGLHEQR